MSRQYLMPVLAVCSTGTITGSGYYNASCSFSPLTFGKVAENKVAKALLMKFDRSGDIFDEAGNRVASFLVTNTQHDMPDNADLQFTVYDSDNISTVKLTVASYISPAVYNSLQSGQYTARIYYSSTWQMIFNIPGIQGQSLLCRVPADLFKCLW